MTIRTGRQFLIDGDRYVVAGIEMEIDGADVRAIIEFEKFPQEIGRESKWISLARIQAGAVVITPYGQEATT